MVANISCPYSANIQTPKDFVIDQDLDLISKQDNDHFHAFEIGDIQHGQIHENMNFTI